MLENRAEVDRLFVLTYDQLRRLASKVGDGRSGVTLNPTALVNEAYLKLSSSLRTLPDSRLHFKRIAARAMRQVIVEAVRRRRAQKRGGGEILVTLDDGTPGFADLGEDLLALDAALNDLASQYPRQARMVEYRFFGGYDVAETAELLGVSEATVARDWRVARAWLTGALKQGA